MAGPVSALLLSSPPTDAQRAALRASIRDIATTIRDDHFWVATTLPLGGTLNAFDIREPQPFFYTLEPLAEVDFMEEAEVRRIEARFHCPLAYCLTIGAMCSGPVNHRLLGEITAYFARQLLALVHLGGPLSPADTAGVRGQIHDIGYDAGDHEAYYSVCDAEFMQYWLQSPNFKMIK